MDLSRRSTDAVCRICESSLPRSLLLDHSRWCLIARRYEQRLATANASLAKIESETVDAMGQVKAMMSAPQLQALGPHASRGRGCCASLHVNLLAQCEAYLGDLRYTVACIVWVRQLDLWSNAAQRYWSGHVALLWKIRPMSSVCTRLERLLDAKRRCFICVNNITERVRERAAALQRASGSARSEVFERFVLGPVLGVRNSGLRNAPGQYGLGIGRPMGRRLTPPSGGGPENDGEGGRAPSPTQSHGGTAIGSFFERTRGTFESTVQASFLRSRRGNHMEKIRRARVAFEAAAGRRPSAVARVRPDPSGSASSAAGSAAALTVAASVTSPPPPRRGKRRTSGSKMTDDGKLSTDLTQFEMLSEIARGAFGRVRLVRKRITGDVFALKEIDKAQCMRKNQAAQTLVEVDALRRAGSASPFVVQIYYSFQTKRSLFLVLEYCPGGDCAALLANCGRLEEHVALVYIAETLLALRHVHGLGFVHRDLKPEQLLIDATGHIKLTDFGLSQEAISGEVAELRFEQESGEKRPSTLRRDFDGAGLNLDDDVDALFEDEESSDLDLDEGDDGGGSIDATGRSGSSAGAADSARTSRGRSESGESREVRAPNSLSAATVAQTPPVEFAAHPPPPRPRRRRQKGRPGGAVSAAAAKRGSVCGTPDYMAPEVLAGAPTTAAVDLWSCGCILYEFVVGAPPFADTTPQKIFRRVLAHRRSPHLNWPPIDIFSQNGRELISGLLTAAPEDRFTLKDAVDHAFFRGVCWEGLREADPPFVPAPANEEDVSYFGGGGLGRNGSGGGNVVRDSSGSLRFTFRNGSHGGSLTEASAVRTSSFGAAMESAEQELMRAAFTKFSSTNLVALHHINVAEASGGTGNTAALISQRVTQREARAATT
jgi:serine/threonine protein kinase